MAGALCLERRKQFPMYMFPVQMVNKELYVALHLFLEEWIVDGMHPNISIKLKNAKIL